jgi:hypothetical protein
MQLMQFLLVEPQGVDLQHLIVSGCAAAAASENAAPLEYFLLLSVEALLIIYILQLLVIQMRLPLVKIQ